MAIGKRFLKEAFSEAARSYGALQSRFADWKSGYKGERIEFESKHGYPLDLKNPQSFSQKLCWRKIYDRNPLLPLIVDKIAVRGYVRRVLGEREAEAVLVPLLFSTTDPTALPFHTFPEEYIVKANHGSGWNLIVRGNHRPEPEQIIAQCRNWLMMRYGVELHEWAYQNIERRILVEPLLKGDNDKPPREYKFHMFGGKCAVIQALHSDSWYDGINLVDSSMPTLTYFTADWSWLDVSWHYHFLLEQFPVEPSQPPPQALPEMLALAETLSSPFNYLRVDLYSSQDGVKLGELTPYHLSGHSKITPMEFDFELGRKWQLRKSGWRNWKWRSKKEDKPVESEDFEKGNFAATSFGPGTGGCQIVSDDERVVSGHFSVYGKGNPSKSEWCEFLYSDNKKLALKKNASYAVTFKYKAVEAPSGGGFYYFVARSSAGGIVNDRGFAKWPDSAGSVATKTINITLGNFDDYYLIWGIHGQGAMSIDEIKIVKM